MGKIGKPASLTFCLEMQFKTALLIHGWVILCEVILCVVECLASYNMFVATKISSETKLKHTLFTQPCKLNEPCKKHKYRIYTDVQLCLKIQKENK